MDQSYASKYHRLEETHWWFRGRRDIIYRLIKDYPKDAEILEVGCSGGVLIKFLKNHGFKRLRGIDIDKGAIKLCTQKGIDNVIAGDAEKIGFKNYQFDIIIASDVLEHIRDDDKAIIEWFRILKPKGRLIVFVPAFKFLWSKHDEINQHYRRYTKRELVERLVKNGFRVERISYWNFFLFLPISLIRLFQRHLLLKRISLKDQLYEIVGFDKITPLINALLGFILRLENRFLINRINFPIGVSAFAIARKL